MKLKPLAAVLACVTIGIGAAGCAPKEEADKSVAEAPAAPAVTESAAPAEAPAAPAAGAETVMDLSAVIGGSQRTPQYAERDQFRHPAETLEFMGIKPDMAVVEIAPGGGWYTEILAPYLKDTGTFYAAHFPADSEVGYFQRSLKAFKDKLQSDQDSYGKVIVTEFDPGSDKAVAPAGSADMVLTFRNVHNWMNQSKEEAAFAQFFAALKPGGVLGVVEHRAKPGTSREDMIKSGYVTQDYVIEVAKGAGFEFEEASEVNANPKDTADHPKGVWTLPPSLRLKDEDREKYMGIGESDRMTLRFRKPAE